MQNSLPAACDRAMSYVAARASGKPLDRSMRVTVNFQPDRRSAGKWILEQLVDDGCYRSQFETGFSSGAVPVDSSCRERWQFEHDIFGGAPWYGSAHVHGSIALKDIEALTLDPSFCGTAVQRQAQRIGVPIHWHSGFAVDTATIRTHSGFRGPATVELACGLARDGRLTPAHLTAAAEVGVEPRALRRVWHYLARFGTAGQ